MYKLLFAFCLLALILSGSSCRLNPDTQKPGISALQGEWQQDSVPRQNELLTYSLHHFRFSCDSFFIAIKTFSKINYGADSCMSRGRWMEYSRGVYGRRNDTLFLKGQFCNPDYTIKENAGCFRIGIYEEIFRIDRETDSLISLSSITGVVPVNARLIKHTDCHIKPL